MLDIIWNWTLKVAKFAFGTGGLFVFVSKNLALALTALFWHHGTVAEAAYAVSPFLAMLIGDGIWYLGLILLRRQTPVTETLAKAVTAVLPAKRRIHAFRFATTGNA